MINELEELYSDMEFHNKKRVEFIKAGRKGLARIHTICIFRLAKRMEEIINLIGIEKCFKKAVSKLHPN